MTFELLLRPRRDNQISHLRKKETSQLTHALDFAYLFGDALFELLISGELQTDVLFRRTSPNQKPRNREECAHHIWIADFTSEPVAL